ncbi:DnaJ domain-containing protein [Phenylobacterium sp.]|uniref:DnaJ domain-containing protein n=1 Tax=Phenylobacterium sp. TaxID=1871053 RepID=UPI0028A2A4B6|nr:DnaJ domain-containing protein [Phenylobacterium sp.]
MLGVAPAAAPAELRRAFREAAKLAHPDRPGGDAERFRQVVEAYRLLSEPVPADQIIQPPATVRKNAPDGRILPITPLLALNGGVVLHETADGRGLKITLPAGLRSGDLLRAGKDMFEIAVRGDGEIMLRGHDLWVTAPLHPHVLAQGGRVAVDTPLGRRVVWITRKAAERGLIRLAGQGLPARGDHPQGHLFLRLTEQTRTTDTAARALRRRFAAAWAA